MRAVIEASFAGQPEDQRDPAQRAGKDVIEQLFRGAGGEMGVQQGDAARVEEAGAFGVRLRSEV